MGEGLAEALAKPHAVTALIFLLDDGPASANRLAKGMGGSEAAVGVVMAEHLRLNGLAEIDTIPSPFPGRQSWSISLTPLGKRVAQGLRELATYYEQRWQPETERPRRRRRT